MSKTGPPNGARCNRLPVADSWRAPASLRAEYYLLSWFIGPVKRKGNRGKKKKKFGYLNQCFFSFLFPGRRRGFHIGTVLLRFANVDTHATARILNMVGFAGSSKWARATGPAASSQLPAPCSLLPAPSHYHASPIEVHLQH